MRAQNQDQSQYTIWQAKETDYLQKHAHLYWMQLYKHFYVLNYLNKKQITTIIKDLSEDEGIYYEDNIPKLITGKIFKLKDKEEYFLLRQSRIPTSVDLQNYQNEDDVKKYLKTRQYKEFLKELDEETQQIAQNGYYQSKTKKIKSFSIFRIDKDYQTVKLENFTKVIRNSIIVQFSPFQDSKLTRFKIEISIKSQISHNQVGFHQIFPDLKELSRSLLQIPQESKFKLQDSNYITYDYQQPQQQRYREFGFPHLALAFQGGGVKGLSYIGVYTQISKLQQLIQSKSNKKINLPIKSLIGSSAGGILALCIATQVAQSELLQLCLMMDTFLQDLLIQTVEQGQRAQKEPYADFNKKNVIPIQPGYFSGQVNQLKGVLHDLGLIQDGLSQIFVQTLKQPSLQDKLIKILSPLVGSSASSLLTFKQNQIEEITGEEVVCCCCGFSCCCCKKTVKKPKMINYYGFLYMALMSGDALENVAAFTLVFYLRKAAYEEDQNFKAKFQRFLKRKNTKNILTRNAVIQQAQKVIKSYKQFKKLKQQLKKAGKRVLKSQITYASLPLMKFAKSMTMKDYYLLTEVELTCTSVDLNDKIQRFFNHKTSPQLPVCKAVQMTGSFPIAFQSQRWKRQWGPYYIYHETSRRQVNLEGHNFTDGGLFANFPIRYLDNEKFRPMYFSHRLNKNTVLYGFGLEELEDFPQNIPKEELDEAVNSFKKQFLLRVAPKILKYLICGCSSQRYYESPQFELINFLLSLVSAMQHSDRILNIECFEPEIIRTKLPPQDELTMKNSQLLKKIELFQQALAQFKQSTQTHFQQQYSQLIYQQLKCLKDRIFQLTKNEQLTLKEAKKLIDCHIAPNGIFSAAFESYKQMLKNKFICYKFENNDQVFVTEEYQQQLIQFFREFESQILRKEVNISSAQINCIQWCRQMSLAVKQMKNNLKEKEKLFYYEKAVYIPEERLKRLMNARYKFTPFVDKLYKQKFTSIKGKMDLKKISINYYAQNEIYKKYYEISSKVQKVINLKIEHYLKEWGANKKPIDTLDLNLNIILEAFSLSHYYYPQIIEIVENVLTKVNNERRLQFRYQKIGWKDLTINIISCTDFHAIYGVLYVLGLSTSQIKERMCEIKSLFQVRKNLNQQFKSQIWLKSSLQKLQSYLKRQWQQRFDLVASEQQLQMLYPKQFQKQIKKCQLIEDFRIKHRFFEMEITTYLQKILNYVSFSFEELKKLQPKKRKKRISQLLNLHQFKEQHQSHQKKGKRFLLDLMSHLAEQFIVVSQLIMKTETYVNIKEISQNDDRFFKGLVLQSLISAFQYKKYIFNLLQSKALEPNITLQNFYHLAQKKILLNFTCIKVNQCRFQLINMHTKPHMPLYAALMAAASLPFLLGEFTSREQWQIDQRITNLRKATATAFFNKLEQNPKLSSYISGNFISILPIELLSNSKVIKNKLLCQDEKSIQNTKIIEVSFAFEYQKQTKNNYDSQYLITNLCNALKGKTKFINCWDLCKHFCEFLCCCCCSTQGIGWYLSEKLDQLQIKNLLNLRLNSNDSFIYSMYQRYLIKLPVRYNTLQFDKVTMEKPILRDTIRQAQEVVRELTDVIHVKDETIIFQKFAKNTTLEVSFVVNNNVRSQTMANNKSYYYRLKFISHTIWRKLSGKYAIFYKIGNSSDFKRVHEDYFDIEQDAVTKRDQKIYVKFIYCSPQSYKIKERIHILSLSYLRIFSQHKGQASLLFLRAVFRFPYRNILIDVEAHPLQGEWAGLQPVKPQFQRKCLPPSEQSNQIFQKLLNKSQLSGFIIPKYPLLCIVTKIVNEKSTMFCLNEDCNRQRLTKSINPLRQREQCASCKSQLNLIVMDCSKCKSKHCLHCKIENFLVMKITKESSNTVTCCTQGHSLRFQSNLPNLKFCLYCGKYYDYLWKEQCGMTLCSNCLVYIPQNEIQDFIEEENSL